MSSRCFDWKQFGRLTEVKGGSANCLHERFRIHHSGKTKVGDLDGKVVALVGEEHVFGLEVPVGDALVVEVLDSEQQLHEDHLGLGL